MSDAATPNTPSAPQQQSKSALAIVGLVLGIIALLGSALPIINNLSFFFALLGLVFAVIGLVGTLRGKHSGKGLAIASVVVNVLAVVIVLATQSLYSSAIDDAVVSTSDGTVVSSADAEGSEAADAATDEAATSGDAAAADASQYTISDEAIESDEYSSTISGSFTNTSGGELSYVGLTYNVYDADGNQIDNAYANTTNLADGATWKFEAWCAATVDEVGSYELAEVTAY